MNKWLYRAAGALGVASGTLLLGSGMAHAEAAGDAFSVAEPTVDPLAMHARVADYFTPAGGPFAGPFAGSSAGPFTDPIATRVAASSAGPIAEPIADRIADREEFIGGLGGAGGSPLGGLTGGVTGVTGGLGGITGSKGGNNMLGGLAGAELLGSVAGTVTSASPLGDLTGGLGGLTGGGSPLSSLTGGGGSPLSGLTGGASSPLSSLTTGGPLSSLTGGGGSPLSSLTTGASPLSGLTAGLTDQDGPLTTVTGGLTGGDGGSRAVTGQLTGNLFSGEDRSRGLEPVLGSVLSRDNLTAATLGPVSTDLIDPVLRGTSGDTTDQQGIQLDPDTARKMNDLTAPMVSALIADAVTKHMGMTADDLLSTPAMAGPTGPARDFLLGQSPVGAAGRAVAAFDPAAFQENFPVVNDLPLLGTMLGNDGPLGNVVAVGDVHRGIPLVGPTLDGQFSVDSVTQLPVVSGLVHNGLLKTSDGPGLPVVGSLPFVGDALNQVGKPDAAPPAQTLPAPAGALGQVSTMGQLAPVAAAAPAGAGAAQVPLHVGRHRATGRPEVIDPDYLESGSLPLVGSLTGGGDEGLPLIGPMLKQLPLLGSLI